MHRILLVLLSCVSVMPLQAAAPNILFLFADDWGRHASIYAKTGGAPGTAQISDLVQTPNFDKIARRGVLFRNAHVNAPSCTPCRSSLLSGQYFWRTGRGGILIGAVWDSAIPTFPLLLRDQGFHIGKTFKVWSPGTPADSPFGGQQYAYETAGRRFNRFSTEACKLMDAGKTAKAAKDEILGEVAGNFESFLKARPKDQPFCYWFGPTNTHRIWKQSSGAKIWGLDSEKLKGKLPPFLPDVPEVREDVADYVGEIQAWDAAIGVLLEQLERSGEMDNTLIVISGDHGAPGFPHGKCNLYEFGTGVSLAIAGPGVKGGRVVDDFVNLPDLAPTLLESAGVPAPEVMTGRSLWPVLHSEKQGLADPSRTWVVTGRERHVENARADHSPYPARAIRNAQYSYVINFRPDRYPLGDPFGLQDGKVPDPAVVASNTRVIHPDDDAGPTKSWLVSHYNDPQWKAFYERTYGKRPREELYDLSKDPFEMHNVAADAAYEGIRKDLESRLLAELRRTGDPRLMSDGSYYESPPLAGPPEGAGRKKSR
jgi:N-sulfoglucosamine sulfohydrolase